MRAWAFWNPGELAKVGNDGVQQSGGRASKTLGLHRSIYAADESAACVIHTHSTHLVALTLTGVWSNDDILPPITPYYVMKVGHVPLMSTTGPVIPKWACWWRARSSGCARGRRRFAR